MSVAFDEVQRQLLLEKIAHHDAIMRINLTLQASTYKINELRSYRKWFGLNVCMIFCFVFFSFLILLLLVLCCSLFQANENLKRKFNM